MSENPIKKYVTNTLKETLGKAITAVNVSGQAGFYGGIIGAGAVTTQAKKYFIGNDKNILGSSRGSNVASVRDGLEVSFPGAKRPYSSGSDISDKIPSNNDVDAGSVSRSNVNVSKRDGSVSKSYKPDSYGSVPELESKSNDTETDMRKANLFDLIDTLGKKPDSSHLKGAQIYTCGAPNDNGVGGGAGAGDEGKPSKALINYWKKTFESRDEESNRLKRLKNVGKKIQAYYNSIIDDKNSEVKKYILAKQIHSEANSVFECLCEQKAVNYESRFGAMRLSERCNKFIEESTENKLLDSFINELNRETTVEGYHKAYNSICEQVKDNPKKNEIVEAFGDVTAGKIVKEGVNLDLVYEVHKVVNNLNSNGVLPSQEILSYQEIIKKISKDKDTLNAFNLMGKVDSDRSSLNNIRPVEDKVRKFRNRVGVFIDTITKSYRPDESKDNTFEHFFDKYKKVSLMSYELKDFSGVVFITKQQEIDQNRTDIRDELLEKIKGIAEVELSEYNQIDEWSKELAKKFKVKNDLLDNANVPGSLKKVLENIKVELVKGDLKGINRNLEGLDLSKLKARLEHIKKLKTGINTFHNDYSWERKDGSEVGDFKTKDVEEEIKALNKLEKEVKKKIKVMEEKKVEQNTRGVESDEFKEAVKNPVKIRDRLLKIYKEEFDKLELRCETVQEEEILTIKNVTDENKTLKEIMNRIKILEKVLEDYKNFSDEYDGAHQNFDQGEDSYNLNDKRIAEKYDELSTDTSGYFKKRIVDIQNRIRSLKDFENNCTMTEAYLLAPETTFIEMASCIPVLKKDLYKAESAILESDKEIILHIANGFVPRMVKKFPAMKDNHEKTIDPDSVVVVLDPEMIRRRSVKPVGKKEEKKREAKEKKPKKEKDTVSAKTTPETDKKDQDDKSEDKKEEQKPISGESPYKELLANLTEENKDKIKVILKQKRKNNVPTSLGFKINNSATRVKKASTALNNYTPKDEDYVQRLITFSEAYEEYNQLWDENNAREKVEKKCGLKADKLDVEKVDQGDRIRTEIIKGAYASKAYREANKDRYVTLYNAIKDDLDEEQKKEVQERLLDIMYMGEDTDADKPSIVYLQKIYKEQIDNGDKHLRIAAKQDELYREQIKKINKTIREAKQKKGEESYFLREGYQKELSECLTKIKANLEEVKKANEYQRDAENTGRMFGKQTPEKGNKLAFKVTKSFVVGMLHSAMRDLENLRYSYAREKIKEAEKVFEKMSEFINNKSKQLLQKSLDKAMKRWQSQKYIHSLITPVTAAYIKTEKEDEVAKEVGLKIMELAKREVVITLKLSEDGAAEKDKFSYKNFKFYAKRILKASYRQLDSYMNKLKNYKKAEFKATPADAIKMLKLAKEIKETNPRDALRIASDIQKLESSIKDEKEKAAFSKEIKSQTNKAYGIQYELSDKLMKEAKEALKNGFTSKAAILVNLLNECGHRNIVGRKNVLLKPLMKTVSKYDKKLTDLSGTALTKEDDIIIHRKRNLAGEAIKEKDWITAVRTSGEAMKIAEAKQQDITKTSPIRGLQYKATEMAVSDIRNDIENERYIQANYKLNILEGFAKKGLTHDRFRGTSKTGNVMTGVTAIATDENTKTVIDELRETLNKKATRLNPEFITEALNAFVNVKTLSALIGKDWKDQKTLEGMSLPDVQKAIVKEMGGLKHLADNTFINPKSEGYDGGQRHSNALKDAGTQFTTVATNFGDRISDTVGVGLKESALKTGALFLPRLVGALVGGAYDATRATINSATHLLFAWMPADIRALFLNLTDIGNIKKLVESPIGSQLKKDIQKYMETGDFKNSMNRIKNVEVMEYKDMNGVVHKFSLKEFIDSDKDGNYSYDEFITALPVLYGHLSWVFDRTMGEYGEDNNGDKIKIVKGRLEAIVGLVSAHAQLLAIQQMMGMMKTSSSSHSASNPTGYASRTSGRAFRGSVTRGNIR